MEDGYLEAERIDEQINELLEASSITKENALEWLKFARTIGTTATIIQEHARGLTPTSMSIKRSAVIKARGAD